MQTTSTATNYDCNDCILDLLPVRIHRQIDEKKVFYCATTSLLLEFINMNNMKESVHAKEELEHRIQFVKSAQFLGHTTSETSETARKIEKLEGEGKNVYEIAKALCFAHR